MNGSALLCGQLLLCPDFAGRIIALAPRHLQYCHYINALIDAPKGLAHETALGRTQRQIASNLLNGVVTWHQKTARPPRDKS